MAGHDVKKNGGEVVATGGSTEDRLKMQLFET